MTATQSALKQPDRRKEHAPGLQDSAMLSAHARPKTTRSRSEFAPSLLAPCTDAQAASPHAYRPGTIWSWPPTCFRTWRRRLRLRGAVCSAPLPYSGGSEEGEMAKTGPAPPTGTPTDTVQPPSLAPVPKSKDPRATPHTQQHLTHLPTCPCAPAPTVGSQQRSMAGRGPSMGRRGTGVVSQPLTTVPPSLQQS